MAKRRGIFADEATLIKHGVVELPEKGLHHEYTNIFYLSQLAYRWNFYTGMDIPVIYTNVSKTRMKCY